LNGLNIVKASAIAFLREYLWISLDDPGHFGGFHHDPTPSSDISSDQDLFGLRPIRTRPNTPDLTDQNRTERRTELRRRLFGYVQHFTTEFDAPLFSGSELLIQHPRIAEIQNLIRHLLNLRQTRGRRLRISALVNELEEIVNVSGPLVVIYVPWFDEEE
jgi:hypothetical protein